jgi:hypothetical protein
MPRSKTKRNLGAELFRLVEQDQGWAFISDAIDELPDERVFDIARGALKHTEIVAVKIKRFLKKYEVATDAAKRD